MRNSADIRGNHSTRFRGNSIAPVIQLLLCLSFVGAVDAESTKTPIPPASIKQSSTCFVEQFESLQKYLAFIKGFTPPRSPEQLVEDEARYKYWTTGFECNLFVYSVDGIDVHGFIARPSGQFTASLPVIIYNHGGNADIGWVRPQFIFGKLFPIVKEGFVVIGSQYRGTEMKVGVRGRNETGVPNPDRLRDEFGGADVRDVLALVSIVDKLPYADGKRIGLWGESRGAMMAFIAARSSGRFATIAAVGTPADLVQAAKTQPDMVEIFRTWIPNYKRDQDAALRQRSVMHWVEQLPVDMSVLLLHGADDGRSDVADVLKLAVRLESLGREYQLFVYERGSHSLSERESEVSREIQSWFSRKLKSNSSEIDQKR